MNAKILTFSSHGDTLFRFYDEHLQLGPHE